MAPSGPGSPTAPRLDRDLFVRPIAHRGLHHAATGITENSHAAFAAARDAGYGIECDLRPIAGGLPVVFHDETLDRLTGATGTLADQSADDLARLRLVCGGPVPTFAGLLEQIGGAVPLLVEVKSEWTPPDEPFLTAIAGLASAYLGPLALMSFDPAVVARLATLAPTVPRGLVSGSYRAASGDDWWHDRLPPARAASLRDLADLDAVGGAFCAYEVGALPAAATERVRRDGRPVFTWTVRNAAERTRADRHADAMIFEGFRP